MPTAHDNRAEVGRRIKLLRQAKELSLQELAEKAKVSPGYLSEVERGLSAVSHEKLVDISAGLGVTVSDLTEGRRSDAPGMPEVRIPAALSEAADQLNLSHRATLLLLQGKMSLTARRARDEEAEWTVDDWIRFHNQVKQFLPDC